MAEQKRRDASWAGQVETDANPSSQGETMNEGSDNTVEQIEVLAAGANETIDIEEAGLGQKLDELAVTTEEEVDALKINLFQEDERDNARDGSGLVVDDLAEERIVRLTESDTMQSDLGAHSAEPGRDDTSPVLRKHHSNAAIAPSHAVVEVNRDEPVDETITERKGDEGAAA